MDVLTACHQALVADLWGAVVSAFTAEHVERARIANAAAAEVSVGLSCSPAMSRGKEVLRWYGPESADVEHRASLLARLAVHGPDCLAACRVHLRPHQWAECGMVSVASALLGCTCWKAQT